MTEKKINYDGHFVFYHVIGAGKPVVLIHGFGEDGDVWKRQTEFLKDKFQLIIPHLPGSGKSELINDMSIEGMAEVIKAILENENISTCTMIGHSMGGYITLALAEKYPALLNAFGLFHSTGFPDTEEKIANRRKSIEFIKEHGAFEFLKTTSPNLFSPISANKMGKEVDEFINSLNIFSNTTLIAYYEAMIERPDRRIVLKKTDVPVLFIMGQYDNAVPIDSVLKQCHLPARSFIHILTSSGHMGMMEETAESNEALEEFLSSI